MTQVRDGRQNYDFNNVCAVKRGVYNCTIPRPCALLLVKKNTLPSLHGRIILSL